MGPGKQRTAAKRRPGHRRNPLFLQEGEIAIGETIRGKQAHFDLVRHQLVFHGRLQQREVPWAEVGDANGLHLARHHQCVERLAGFLRIDQRIRAMNEQEINIVGSHVAQGCLDRRIDMASRRIVMLDAGGGVTAGRRDDAAFGDDFDLVTQSRSSLQASTQNGFRRVSAVNIGLIHGGDALRQAGFDLGLHMGGRGVLIVTDAPHAVNDAAEFQCFRKSDAFHQWRSPLPSGVAGVSEGTRP